MDLIQRLVIRIFQIVEILWKRSSFAATRMRCRRVHVSTTERSRRRDLMRTIPLGTIVPAAFIAFGLLRQGHLGDALRQDGWVAVLAFVIGAGTVALPGRLPLLASFAAVVAAGWASTVTAFDGMALFCFVMAGFFFGLCVRSILFQWKMCKTAVHVKDEVQ